MSDLCGVKPTCCANWEHEFTRSTMNAAATALLTSTYEVLLIRRTTLSMLVPKQGFPHQRARGNRLSPTRNRWRVVPPMPWKRATRTRSSTVAEALAAKATPAPAKAAVARTSAPEFCRLDEVPAAKLLSIRSLLSVVTLLICSFSSGVISAKTWIAPTLHYAVHGVAPIYESRTNTDQRNQRRIKQCLHKRA